MAASDERLELSTLDRRYRLAIGLAVVTGLIHLGLGLTAPTTPVGAASILAGIGYGVAIALVLVGYRRRLVVAIGIPYLASQIALWYALKRPASLADVSPAAAIDKPVQLLLIALLLSILYRDR